MNWQDFYPHVLPSVRGCPEELALDHIKKAARNWCTKTRCWTMETPPLHSQPDVDRYPLSLPTDVERVMLMAVWVGTEEYAVLAAPEGRRAARTYSQAKAWLENATDLRLYPVPAQAGTEIATELSVKPALSAEECPDDLADWVPDIAHGAIATLCLLPRYEWTDSGTAQIEQGMFDGRASAVAIQTARGYTKARQRAKSFF